MRDDDLGGDARSVGIQDADRPEGDRGADELEGDEAGTDAGAMPANVFENILANVTAGLAKLVDEVKKYAAAM